MGFYDSLPKLNQRAERYREKAQHELKYCVTCQPYDGGNYIWFLGEETTVDEILNSIDCPERYRDDIAQHLRCPYCGNSRFERYDTVGTEDYYRLQAEDHYEKALKRYEKRIDSFREHLELYPSLPLSHSLGRKIYKEIKEKKVDSTTIFGAKIWYRARGVDKSTVLNSTDMHVPPWGKSSGGRFHHSGQSVLYLADSKQLAMVETLENTSLSSLIWIQEYKNGEKIDNIMDLRYRWEDLGQLSSMTMAALLISGCIFERVEDRSYKWKPQYFITTFIADCARLAGYRGIIYSSSRGDGFNLVLFDSHESITPEGKPNIYIYEGDRDNFNIFDDDNRELSF